MKPLDIFLAVSVPVIWGLGFVLTKPALESFPPILLMAFRFTITALVLVWFVRPPWHLMSRLFLIALVSAALQYGLTFTGLKYLDASTAILVVHLEVPFCAILGAVFLKERLGLRRVSGLIVAFLGVVLIAGEPRIQGNLYPVFLVVGGAFTWAVGQVMVRALGVVGGFTLIAWVAVFAAPQLFVASFLIEEGQLAAIKGADWSVWGTIIYLGLIMTAVGYSIWYRLLGLYEVNLVAPYLLLLPFVVVLGGVFWLGETLTALLLVGGGLIIAGVAVITVEPKPKTAVQSS